MGQTLAFPFTIFFCVWIKMHEVHYHGFLVKMNVPGHAPFLLLTWLSATSRMEGLRFSQ